MSLCENPYSYSSEFEDIYLYMIDFLCVDKEIKPDYVRFQDNRIHIQSAYTNWTEEDGLISCVLTIVLNYGKNQIERDTLGYEVLVSFYFMINGEAEKDEVYRKRFKNLDDVEDYNSWIVFRSHVTPWLTIFKKYQNTEKGGK